MAEGASPVVVLRLADYSGPYTMTVKTSLTGAWRTKRIFVPTVLLFDADLSLTRIFQEDTFKPNGMQLEASIPFGEREKAERFILLYTRGNALGQNAGKLNVTAIPSGTASGAVQGAVGAAIASALIRTERSTEGHIELQTKPVKNDARTISASFRSDEAASHDLHYKVHTEARKVVGTDERKFANLSVGEQTIAEMLPDGVNDLTCWITEKGDFWVESANRGMGLPRGSVWLHLIDKGDYILDPQQHTYFRIPSQVAVSSQGLQPIVTPMKDVVSVAGVPVHHLNVVLSMNSAPSASSTPMSLETNSDLWLAEKYRAYAAAAPDSLMLRSLGLESVLQQGFVMQSITRGSIFGAYQIESVVTEIEEGRALPSLFEIPANYKEVPLPSGK